MNSSSRYFSKYGNFPKIILWQRQNFQKMHLTNNWSSYFCIQVIKNLMGNDLIKSVLILVKTKTFYYMKIPRVIERMWFQVVHRGCIQCYISYDNSTQKLKTPRFLSPDERKLFDLNSGYILTSILNSW